jgi:hypothetical protein
MLCESASSRRQPDARFAATQATICPLAERYCTQNSTTLT